jgi:hypothetical protein
MAITGYNESKLSASEMFDTYKNNSGAKEDPVVRANKLIKSAKQLEPADIETAHVQLKQYSNSLSRAALKAFEIGKTVILYNSEPGLSMTQLIPFLTLRTDSGFKTYIFLDSVPGAYRKGRDGSLIVNSAALHDLLVGALISNAIKSDYGKLTGSEYLEKTLMNLYGQFIFRIINKEYLIGSDKIIYDTLFYFTGRFFLERIFESHNGATNINILAQKHFRFVDSMKAEEIKATYDEANPQQISELLNLIKSLSPRMSGLDLRLLINNWTTYYFPPAYLAIDNVEYLIFMTVSLKNANNLVSINASEIVKETKGIRTLEEELLKLL